MNEKRTIGSAAGVVQALINGNIAVDSRQAERARAVVGWLIDRVGAVGAVLARVARRGAVVNIVRAGGGLVIETLAGVSSDMLSRK